MKKNNIKEWYDKNIKKYSSNSRASSVAKTELNLFAKYVPQRGMILDIGSGLGQDTEYLAKKDYITIGIDFSNKMIKYSLEKRRAGIFINMDFFDVQNIFGEHKFGGLWASSSVLTHANKKDYNKFFKEAKKLLLSAGVLGLIVRKDKPKKIKVKFNNFSENNITSLLTKNGFKIIQFKEINLGKTTWFFIISKNI